MNELFYNVKMPNLTKKHRIRDVTKDIAKKQGKVCGQVILDAIEFYSAHLETKNEN